MKLEAKGALIHEASMTVELPQLERLGAAIGTTSAAESAGLVTWFGATVGGDGPLVDALHMDLSRALLTGQGYRWRRPFQVGEDVSVRVVVDDVYEKGGNQFAVVLAEFRDAEGELIQAQTTTFIERGAT
jgi:acyl dehydratase